ncbi:MAG: M48 family metallopeptidase [Bdellovibrionales bacterium]|nr:M48 family metallopeptidase [Bdellovibrionales bacterium]
MFFDAKILYIAIVALWVSVFVIERLAELLQYGVASRPYPESLSEIQSPADHEKALAYLGERNRLGWMHESVNLVVFLSALSLGFFGNIADFAERLTSMPWLRATLFVAFLSGLKGLLDLPFAWISTFRIEARYGFNRTTPRTFFLDRVKGAILGLLLLAPILAFAIWVLETSGDRAWLTIWAGYTAFQFFLLFIAPIAILPLFLKLTPLPDGELKSAIEAYVAKQTFKLNGVWVCDASKRSTKTNAFFTGFGRFRRLVLFDTMIAKLDDPATTPERRKEIIAEIVAITAHEAGHFRLGHIWKGSLVSAVITAGVLFLAQRLLESPELYLAFGLFPPQPAYGLPLAVMLLGKLGFFGSFAANTFSRRNEYAADRFSVETYGDREALIRGLQVLYRENLAILVQHPFFTALFASHPPLLPRTDAIRSSKT